MSHFDLREKLIMKTQFFSINLICLLAGLNLAPLVSHAAPPLKPVKPVVPEAPPALPKPKAPIAIPQTPKSPAEISKPKTEIEDRKSELVPKEIPKHDSSKTTRTATEPTSAPNKEMIDKLMNDPEIKNLNISPESDAMKGVVAREEAFTNSLTKFLKRKPDHQTSADFETNLLKRLVGEEMFAQKGETKESAEALKNAAESMKQILCAQGKDGKGGCGHSKFGLSCRRITAFLAAASATTLSVPIGKAFYDFLKAQPDKEDKDGKTIEVPGVVEGGKSLTVKDLDKKINEEDPPKPAQESK